MTIEVQFRVEQISGKYCLICYHETRRYVFRYAHPTQKAAEELRKNAQKHFGQPSGVAVDLANNYWRIRKNTKLIFTQRTSQKNSFYVNNPNER